jgi:hypothetical protein
MDIAQVQSGNMGMALFDMYINSVRKAHHKEPLHGSPLIDAVDKAFRSYVKSVEIGNSAMIAGVAAYALNPGGNSVSPVSAQNMAPFLALNVIA